MVQQDLFPIQQVKLEDQEAEAPEALLLLQEVLEIRPLRVLLREIMVVTEHKNPHLTIQEVAVAVQVLLALTLRLQVVLVVQVAVVLEEVVQDLIQEHQELLILEAAVAALVVDHLIKVLLVVQV